MKQSWRFWFIVMLLILAVCGVIWRMVDLMIFQRGFLLGQGDSRSLRDVTMPTYRGIITDRNGVPLAVSVPIDDVWIDPKEFVPVGNQLSQLSNLTNISIPAIHTIYLTNIKRQFAYIERGITPFIGDEIKSLNIPGVFINQEFRRYYPEGAVAAQLLGFTNVDDQGQAGIELEFNQWLEGYPGEKEVLVDRLGDIVSDMQIIKPPQPGNNLALSIDSRIQYVAYRALKSGIKRDQADSGSVVVLNAKTGEVLAMVNLPSFNPNNRPNVQDGRIRNGAVTDVTEPGSTIKVFSVCNALASGKYTPNTPIDTSPGWWMVDGNIVRDDGLNLGLIDVTRVLQKSSNVGVSKMTLTLPPSTLFNLLKRVGFGEITSSYFPGESPGTLNPRALQNQFTLATLSFGYGINVTDLQLAHAYAILANGGVEVPVTLLKTSNIPHGKRIISLKIAKEVLIMMESVVQQGGTATLAQIPGYSISGKTGTVRMIGPNGYEPNHHIGIFVGIAPASNPQLVAAIIIRNPEKGGYLGGDVSAPVFEKVMGAALRILNIPPDALNPQQNNLVQRYLQTDTTQTDNQTNLNETKTINNQSIPGNNNTNDNTQ